VLTRLGVDGEDKDKFEEFRRSLKISACMVWCNITQEGLTHQVFCDLLSSRDGCVLGPKRRTERNPDTGEVKAIDPQVVELYYTNFDLVYADNWPEPRFGPQAFSIYFDAIFKETYHYAPEYIIYGKPAAVTFDFCERVL
jgi:ribonucleotide monophosphatase NagD (HAD superfamily)